MTKDQTVYEGPIARVAYGHYKFRPDRLRNRVLEVVPEPENEYDPRAIALMVVNGTLSHRVGFVPRHQTQKCHNVLEAGGRLYARCTGMQTVTKGGRHYTQDVEIPNVRITTPIHVVPPALLVVRPTGSRRILL